MQITRITLPGSTRPADAVAVRVDAADPNLNLFVTVHLRRKPRREKLVLRGRALTRDEATEALGAGRDDFAAVRRFAAEYGLTVARESGSKRALEMHGKLGEISQAFGVPVSEISLGGQTFLQPDSVLTIPAALDGIILGVTGLDTRPQARPHFRCRPDAAATSAGPAGSFTAPQVAALYSFPSGLDGTGQTIAVIELAGGFSQSDLNTYFQSLGLNTPSVTATSVDGAVNTPGESSAVEVTMDIEVAGAIAPGAEMRVYFAPNSDQGFVDALNEAVNGGDPPTVVSVSWGGAEACWSQQSIDAMNRILEDAQKLGVPVCISTGDSGSTDGTGALAVEFPASSPYALACGGTSLTAAGSTISGEVVWNDGGGATGGGVSTVFSKPSYQSEAVVPAPDSSSGGRGIPDVAGHADPAMGYRLVINGQQTVAAGTSAAAPLWSGLIARFAQSLGGPVGFLNPFLYLEGAAGCFRDITEGSNYTPGGQATYTAGAGWDACTGLGSPNGAALLTFISLLR